MATDLPPALTPFSPCGPDRFAKCFPSAKPPARPDQNAERKKTWAELGALRIGIPSANFRNQIAECQFEHSFGPIFNRVEHRPDPARPRVVEVLGSGAASPHQLAANKKHPASYFTPLSVSSFLFPLCVSVVLFVSHFSYILNLALLFLRPLLLLRVRTLQAEGSRNVFSGGFWRPWMPRPKNHSCSRNCVGLAAFDGKANKPTIS